MELCCKLHCAHWIFIVHSSSVLHDFERQCGISAANNDNLILSSIQAAGRNWACTLLELEFTSTSAGWLNAADATLGGGAAATCKGRHHARVKDELPHLVVAANTPSARVQ